MILKQDANNNSQIMYDFEDVWMRVSKDTTYHKAAFVKMIVKKIDTIKQEFPDANIKIRKKIVNGSSVQNIVMTLDTAVWVINKLNVKTPQFIDEYRAATEYLKD